MEEIFLNKKEILYLIGMSIFDTESLSKSINIEMAEAQSIFKTLENEGIIKKLHENQNLKIKYIFTDKAKNI